MADVQHAALRPGQDSGIHVAHAWEVANQAAREALIVSVNDIGKICRQTESATDASFWVLTNVTGGVAWRRIDAPAVSLGGDPANVDAALASPGAATTAARADHKHSVVVGGPVAIGIANTGGVATSLARSDHVHAHGNLPGGALHALATDTDAGFMAPAQFTKLRDLPASYVAVGGTPVAVDAGAAAAGSATTAAASDHKHAVAVGSPVAVGSTNVPGSANTLARSDHVHAHGDQGGGAQHALATAEAAGFMSPAHFAAVNALPEEGAVSLTYLDTVLAGFAPRAFHVTVSNAVEYAAGSADVGALITMNSSGALTLTLPTHATEAMPIGSVVTVAQLGTGQITFAGASGVTVRTASTNKTRTQNSIASATKLDLNEWIVSGDLAAS